MRSAVALFGTQQETDVEASDPSPLLPLGFVRLFIGFHVSIRDGRAMADRHDALPRQSNSDLARRGLTGNAVTRFIAAGTL